MTLLKPIIFIKRITDITPEMLAEKDIKGLLIDIDNTVALRRNQAPLEGFLSWMSVMKAAGIELMLLSNANPKRVKPFAKSMGLPFYYFTCKPFPLRILLATRKLSAPRKNIAIVGDQIFTDIIGGNLSFIKTILVEPIEVEKDLSYRIKRRLERSIMKNFKNT